MYVHLQQLHSPEQSSPEIKVVMSAMPTSATYMAQAIRTGDEEFETFQKFFECWLIEQDQHLQALVAASKAHEDNQMQNEEENGDHVQNRRDVDDRFLAPLVERVIQHYEHYYRAKSRWAKNDILSMYNPSWRSSLEDAFMWIGGWRPSMAFHLLYSKSGLQLEARLVDLIRGFGTGELNDLSPNQLNQVNELQKKTIREEKDITEKLAKQQETVADTTMVELSHAVTELIREGEVGPLMEDARIDATLGPKEEALAEILQKADDLRLKTLKNVINVLTPMQGVHFLIAAAELHLRFHEWGKKRDARHHHQNGDQHMQTG